jgi:hypothetical protein
VILLAAFRVAFPEFGANVADALINAKLADAANQIDPELYGPTTDQAHGLLTAHLLALAPGGQMARLKSDSSKSTYGEQFNALRDAAACGIRVFG